MSSEDREKWWTEKPEAPDWFLPVGTVLWYVAANGYDGTARVRRLVIEKHRPAGRGVFRHLYSCRADDGKAVPVYTWGADDMRTKRDCDYVSTDRQDVVSRAIAGWSRQRDNAARIVAALGGGE